MAKNSDLVYNAVMKFTEGNFRNRVFVAPDIPAKKLANAQSKYITRNDPIVVLIDDTLFGSAKDGLAISENYVYAKGTLGDIKSVKISSIRSVSSQSNKLGSLDIYFGGNLIVTLSTIDKADHDFVIGILKAAYAASKSGENSTPAKVSKSSKSVAAEPKPKNSNSVKAMVACSECSANLPAGAKFCLECGTKVLPKGVCFECNAKLPEKAKFCSECGTPAGKVPAKPVQPKVDTQALVASIGITDAPANGGGQGAIDSSEGMVSGEIVDWHQAADCAEARQGNGQSRLEGWQNRRRWQATPARLWQTAGKGPDQATDGLRGQEGHCQPLEALPRHREAIRREVQVGRG